jgi:glycosyltransferase involved in cell wall biosynthesis
MKILFFSYYNPLGKGGFEKQGMGLMKTLANQGHEIACLTISTPSNQAQIKSDLEATKIFKLSYTIIYHTDNPYTKISQLLFWLNTHPSKYLAHQKPNLNSKIQESIRNIIAEQNIDLIHVLGLRSIYYLPTNLDKPTVLDLVDSMSLRKYRALEALRKSSNNNFSAYLYHFIDLYKTTRIEKDILKLYSKRCPVITISPIDRDYLLTIYHSDLIKSVTAGIDFDNQKSTLSTKPISTFRKRIVFYGFIQEHNIDALLYLINDIIPIVQNVHSDLELRVTGINLPSIIFELSQNLSWLNIEASVDDIVEFIDSASLTCWPFRLGCGIKTKILECMAFGKPVVTTTIGAEALTKSQKKGLLIADTAQGLADHIIYLLDNPNERLRLGEINHQIAIKDFTWEKKAQDYLKLYQLAQQQIKDKDL